MMENYAEASVDYAKGSKCLAEVHNVQIHQRAELALSASTSAAQPEGSKQNFGFGAEYMKTQSHQQEAETLSKHETEIKTNPTNITSTATTEAKELLAAEKEAATTMETPVCVPVLSNSHTTKLDKERPANEDTDEDEDDDDDAEEEDSYESEEEKRETDPLGAVSQDSDESTSDSDFSDLSGLSDMSGREWKPTRPINWVQKQIHSGANPRELLSQMLPSSAHQIAPGLNDMTLWRILASLISEPPRRQKLRYINTFEDVVQLVLQSENVIVLTGAGVSVSCGIPDFRSSDGIYSRLAKDYPDLPDPQAMFDINYFSRDPRPFYKFAREIYPGQFKPSPCHRFIKLLEAKQKLLRNYTQNIDTLEQVAGIKNVIECHGSFSTASCTKCKFKCSADDIRPDIFAQRIPVCPRCQPNVQQSVDASEPVSELELKRLVENGIMKPDIVFFGEGLPQEFHTVMASDKDKCDLLIVMGSSLKVRPVALIPSSIPAHVPQILINREQLHHLEFDVELLGDSDVIINQLCHRLADDWQQICFNTDVLKESKELLPLEEDTATEGEGEDDTQQLQDTDTQSIKSNASTDIALRSAGAYSDSGFESSTSSGVCVSKISAAVGLSTKSMDPLNTSILALNSEMVVLNKNAAHADLLPPLDEPSDAVDCASPEFQPFTERLGQKSTLCTENYRHLSIDSSKDSGIQCDSSNSALATGSTSALLPPITSFGDSGGTSLVAGNSSNAFDTTTALQISSATATANNAQISLNSSNKTATTTTTAKDELKRRELKRQSAAERLITGTYYCHESSSSYVFPGAQVSWCSDSEEDEEEEVNDGDAVGRDFGEEDPDADTNLAPLSPLLPPSVEAEMVSEIATTTHAFATSFKRPADDNLTAEAEHRSATATCNSFTHISNKERATSTSAAVLCSPPPAKRRRDSTDSAKFKEMCSSTTTYITTTINTTSTSSNSSSGNSLEASSVTEALLQQF